MINASTITEAMQTLLKSELPSSYTIERGEYINMDYEKTPWVGIYRGDLDYDTATLGPGANNWKADFTIKIIVQSSNLKASAENAENDLEEYIKAILDAVMTDKTVGGTVAMVKGIKVQYSYNEADSEDMYFQNAEINILTEVRTS